MSTPEAQPAPAPRLGIRLACWFGLYGAGQLLFLIVETPSGFWAFPMGILLLFLAPFRQLPPLSNAAVTVLIGLPYLIFLSHLLLTLRVRSLKGFKLLILCLVMLLIADGAGFLFSIFLIND